jgi:hypothetical protein
VAISPSVSAREFSEAVLQHLVTGRSSLCRLILRLDANGKCRNENDDNERKRELLKRAHGRERVSREIRALAERIENCDELLERSWCHFCARIYGFKMKERDEDKTRKLLKIFSGPA